mgnify:CR=1 FL=1
MLFLSVDMKKNELGLIVVSLMASFALLACAASPEVSKGSKATVEKAKKLIVLHDSNLSRSFHRLARSFEGSHDDVEVSLESSAGVLVARKVADLSRRVDIVAVSDYRMIQELLMPKNCEWYVCFAYDTLVLAYTQRSRHQSRLSKNNWFRTLARKDVSLGMAAASTDPCGYRSQLLLKLADEYYRCRINGLSIEEALTSPAKEPVTRPSVMDLLPLLQSGSIDYLFTYRSLAEQQGMKYLELNKLINLGSPHLSHYYRRVSLELDLSAQTSQAAKTAKTKKETSIQGEPIVYAFAILRNPRNEEIARLFADYLLGPEGEALLGKSHQRVIRGGRIGFTETSRPWLGS